MTWNEEPIKKSYSVKILDGLTTKVEIPRVQSKICRHCGYDFAEFVKTGYLGCSVCYQSFQHELENYLNEYR